MKYLFLTFTLAIFQSCLPFRHRGNGMPEVYVCGKGLNNYLLSLKTNKTYLFKSEYDEGSGKWSKQEKYLIIKYDVNPIDPVLEATMSGGILKGTDTLLICGPKTIKYGKVKMKRMSRKRKANAKFPNILRKNPFADSTD